MLLCELEHEFLGSKWINLSCKNAQLSVTDNMLYVAKRQQKVENNMEKGLQILENQ